jgi:hypothetical protein
MGIGVGLFLIAIGAILAYAVDVQVQGVDLTTVGVILMVVGAIGVVLSLVFWSTLGTARRQRRVYEDDRPDGRLVEERDERF